MFAGGNLALLLLASSITAFVSPAAGGSGIPEVKAYLNGVDAPNIFSLRTLAVKVRRRRACLLVFLSYPARPRRRFLAACTWPPPRRCQLSCVHLDCSQTLMTNVARTDISSSKCIMATRNRAICQKKKQKNKQRRNKEKIDALHGTE